MATFTPICWFCARFTGKTGLHWPGNTSWFPWEVSQSIPMLAKPLLALVIGKKGYRVVWLMTMSQAAVVFNFVKRLLYSQPHDKPRNELRFDLTVHSEGKLNIMYWKAHCLSDYQNWYNMYASVQVRKYPFYKWQIQLHLKLCHV